MEDAHGSPYCVPRSVLSVMLHPRALRTWAVDVWHNDLHQSTMAYVPGALRDCFCAFLIFGALVKMRTSPWSIWLNISKREQFECKRMGEGNGAGIGAGPKAGLLLEQMQ